MPQAVRQRLQGTIDYNANGQDTLALSRGMLYRELYLYMQGQLTVAAAANTAAATFKGDEWAAVNRIEVIANGTEVLFSMDANALWWLNFFWYGAKPTVTPTIGDAATLNPTFRSALILPFWMPRAIRPIDSALDARQLSSLEVRVTWNDHLSINAGATGFTTNPTIEVYSLESSGIEGRFSQWRRFRIQQDVTSASARLQVALPVGPVYRGFIINQDDNGADVTDILNNIRLVSGSTVFYDMDVEDGGPAHQIGLLRNGLDRGYSGTAYDDMRQGNNNDLDAWHNVDLVTDGFLSEAVDTLGFSELNLEFDVSLPAGTNRLFIYPQQIIPVRGGR